MVLYRVRGSLGLADCHLREILVCCYLDVYEKMSNKAIQVAVLEYTFSSELTCIPSSLVLQAPVVLYGFTLTI
jgi:hypothetical protein